MHRVSGKSGLPAAERWAGIIQRRPVIAAVLSGAFILVLAHAPDLPTALVMLVFTALYLKVTRGVEETG